MRTWPMILLVVGCATPQAGGEPSRSDRSKPVLELRVDRSATGVSTPDGSSARPFSSINAALAAATTAPVRIRVATGLYEEQVSLRTGQRLEGAGTVVLAGGQRPSSLHLQSGSSVERISVQGGDVGALVEGDSELKNVSFSGQRTSAIRVTAGTLRLHEANLQASLSTVVGLAVTGKATTVVRGSTFTGPFTRAIQLDSGGTLDLEGGRFEGPVVAVHQKGGAATIHKTRISGGRGPALFVSEGRLKVTDVTVDGHEYGLLARSCQDVQVKTFTSRRAERAGIGWVKSRGTLDDVQVLEHGGFGGLQFVASVVRARKFRVRGGTGYGVNIRGGSLDGEDGEVRNMLEGDGFHCRDAQVQLSAVHVENVEGIGFLFAEGTRAQLGKVSAQGCRAGALVAETLAEVSIESLKARQSVAAIVVPGDAEVKADEVIHDGEPQMGVWAECARGASVRIKRIQPNAPTSQHQSCVEVTGQSPR